MNARCLSIDSGAPSDGWVLSVHDKSLGLAKLLKQSVEGGKVGVFDDHAAAAVLILDANLEAERSL